jgi:LPXTG-motif cell wall-anchored protein
MTFENMDAESENVSMQEDQSPPPEGGSNRTFFMVAGVIGGIMIVALICLALYALVAAPQLRARETQNAQAVAATNTQMAISAIQTANAAKFTAVPTITPLLPTALPTATSSPTPVLAVPTQVIVSPTIDRTGTVAALLTEAAAGKLTATATASGLPDTGFMDNVGAPGLLGLAVVLIVVIFLVRRLRTAS